MVIGKGNDLIWKIPNDQARFKNLTMGHPVIMGRKTWESIPEKFRPLPGRTNFIITRDSSYSAPGATVTTSIENALASAQQALGNEEIFVVGGGEIYKAALPFTDRLYITMVDKEVEGDTFFPAYSNIFTKKISEESGEFEGLKYSYLILER
ncbi:MAG: dihydrofolate reductase [Parcubacteria group bacterium GW2011_GWF2_44_8b]|nr:MAG: dihydrofolate reductase [Parcubacteria group bacterium GW2011_GWC1_43_30]KKT80683.1 MAG: dihydrofolate reductase [Parcubacteria group bacterium GW2011_GWF2_44_8b]